MTGDELHESTKDFLNKTLSNSTVLIDCAYGDYMTEKEIKKDIIIFKELGCKGIVSGILTKDNNIDISRTRELIELSKPIEFTFHRAFDEALSPIDALHQLIELKADRILTSGQAETAVKGLDLLKELINIAENKIIIMPGSGVNINNILEFKKIGSKEIHGSFIKDPNNKNSISDFNEIFKCINII